MASINSSRKTPAPKVPAITPKEAAALVAATGIRGGDDRLSLRVRKMFAAKRPAPFSFGGKRHMVDVRVDLGWYGHIFDLLEADDRLRVNLQLDGMGPCLHIRMVDHEGDYNVTVWAPPYNASGEANGWVIWADNGGDPVTYTELGKRTNVATIARKAASMVRKITPKV